MLDCSRNAVMSIDGLKRFILNLKKMEYNTLLLYTEDTYEVDGEPYFGYMRGKYTKNQLKEIVAYAALHNIEVIPCIQTLAHLNQIFHWSVYQDIKDVNDILLVGNKKSYALIESMFKTLRECFTSDRIHIGMDEAHMLGFGKYRSVNGVRAQTDIFLEHLRKVCEIAEKYAFRPLIWSDMFFRMQFDGTYHIRDGAISEEVKNAVPQNVGLVLWDYYHSDNLVYEHMLNMHKSFNREVWFAGGLWKWVGFKAGNYRTLKNTRPALEECERTGVTNIMMTAWGDDGNECPVAALLPSLFFASEYVKGNKDLEQIKKKFKETLEENFDDFLLLDLILPDEFNKRADDSSGSRTMLFSDPFVGYLDSTVRGDLAEDKYYANLAKRLKQASERSKNFSYIFDSYSALCDVLSLKYSLGAVTRKAYQERNIKQIGQLLEKYDLVIEKLETFIRQFRKMWYQDNKPFGFEVQELRLGGLLLRLKSCKQRLFEFYNGESNMIEELEEKILDYHGEEKVTPAVTDILAYAKIVSPNVL